MVTNRCVDGLFGRDGSDIPSADLNSIFGTRDKPPRLLQTFLSVMADDIDPEPDDPAGLIVARLMTLIRLHGAHELRVVNLARLARRPEGHGPNFDTGSPKYGSWLFVEEHAVDFILIWRYEFRRDFSSKLFVLG